MLQTIRNLRMREIFWAWPGSQDAGFNADVPGTNAPCSCTTSNQGGAYLSLWHKARDT